METKWNANVANRWMLWESTHTFVTPLSGQYVCSLEVFFGSSVQSRPVAQLSYTTYGEHIFKLKLFEELFRRKGVTVKGRKEKKHKWVFYSFPLGKTILLQGGWRLLPIQWTPKPLTCFFYSSNIEGSKKNHRLERTTQISVCVCVCIIGHKAMPERMHVNCQRNDGEKSPKIFRQNFLPPPLVVRARYRCVGSKFFFTEQPKSRKDFVFKVFFYKI